MIETTTFAELIDSAYGEAKKQFELSRPMPGGGSSEAHLQTLAKARGIEIEEHVGVDNMPKWEEEIGYLLKIFSELSSSRTMGYASVNPISYAEMAAWQAVSGITLNPVERQIIKAIDAAFCEVMNGRCNCPDS